MSTISVTDPAAVAAETPASPGPRPLHKRVVDVFFSPDRVALDYVDEKAPWLGPLLIPLFIVTLLWLVTPLMFPIDQVAENMTNAAIDAGAPDVIPAEELAAQMRANRPKALITTLAMKSIYPFAIAVVLLGVFTFLLDGKAKYRQYLAMATHSLLILQLGELLMMAIPMILKKPIHLSLGILVHKILPHDSIPFKLLAVTTVFDLWLFAVLGVAVAVVNGKGSWWKYAGMLLGIQYFFILVISLFFRLATGQLWAG